MMYACVVEDKRTFLRTTFLCGCLDTINALRELGAAKKSTFRTSAVSECSNESAERIRNKRLSNETELIQRVGFELSEYLNWGVAA